MIYYVQENIGKSRYVLSFHDGVKTHKDGSPFYDVRICNSKKQLNAEIKKLNAEIKKLKGD